MYIQITLGTMGGLPQRRDLKQGLRKNGMLIIVLRATDNAIFNSAA